MFASALRPLARHAPRAAVAGAAVAASAGLGCQPQGVCQPLHVRCEASAAINTPTTKPEFRVPSTDQENKGVTLAVGKKFLTLYFADYADAKGKVDLSQNMSYSKTKHLLEAAGGRAKDIDGMFALMDTDNSNTVDYVEIVAYFCSYGVGTLQEKASFFFHACDVDGSGTIEKPELKEVVHHMMLLKKETQGRESFMEWQKTLYAGIPETYVLHLQANELVHDVFSTASKDGEQLSEKELQKWMLRGGKLVNRLTALFNK